MRNKVKNELFSFIILLLPYINAQSTTFTLLSDQNDFSQISFSSSNSLNETAYTIRNNNKDSIDITHSPSEDKVFQINSLEDIEFNVPLSVNSSSIDFMFSFENSHIKMDNKNQWILISIDDFEDGAMGWSKSNISTCGTNDNKFLGGYCKFGGDTVEKNFTGLMHHKMIKITANFHFFDEWEGEQAYMMFNNKIVWAESYKWCNKVDKKRCKANGINACGADFPDRIGVPVEFVTFHNQSDFMLKFGSNLIRDPCEASWGIDNIAIYIK